MAGASEVASPPNSAATSTFSKPNTQSIRSYRAHPSTIRTVVTSPPWARDEPPSPGDEVPSSAPRDHISAADERPSTHRPSDVTSYHSSIADENNAGPSRWWAFTRPRPDDSATQPLAPNAARHRDRSLSVSWLPSSLSRRPGEHGEAAAAGGGDFRPRAHDRRLHIDLPPIHQAPITLAQTRTPGWETPWTPRAPGVSWSVDIEESDSHEHDGEKLSKWQRRKKRIRVYMLTNTYVPLLFRFVNITFTASALAIGIRIRLTENRYKIMGALGASPTLVIIFAPLTLVHVIVAIYLEYFGRPLGLWRTSGKLAHTLVEVVFICAWSAALALSFDNFFTSVIPCASPAATRWYSDIQPATKDLNNMLPGFNGHTGVGGMLCNEQLALICLVGVGLIMYCFNLVISLYRIFEKVKYHPVAQTHG
ncbi:hypothetical protein PHLGIDRAFT_97789 [Phlebiopsis gigantea 11061_1 CR5-6]|uniref:Uncharacterized protein n=1 Tax=Phlebiopsis gigantea (strain 11061_1 CR5-6) TaxID=745531 RepID=A0A0C3PWQ0_PHLG1|nr:hypothetical protein PHLGIDRAFT_97789 [Phlebiopsis gigantea 11061_1 CR5-6]